MRHLLEKKEFSIVPLFSRDSPFLFMSAWPILGHFLAHFLCFSSKLPEIAKFSLKIVIFCHFEYFFTFFMQISVPGWGWGGNFQFSANFGRFL